MKGRRILSLALAALTAVSLLTVSASAAGFSDMVGHWARDDVEYLAAQGVVKGTSATTFAPDQKMTACEALLFCSRAAGVSEEDKAAIAADWAPSGGTSWRSSSRTASTPGPRRRWPCAWRPASSP